MKPINILLSILILFSCKPDEKSTINENLILTLKNDLGKSEVFANVNKEYSLKEYHSNGKLYKHQSFKSKIPVGESTIFFKDGTLKEKKTMNIKGKVQSYKKYDYTGNMIYEEVYSKGRIKVANSIFDGTKYQYDYLKNKLTKSILNSNEPLDFQTSYFCYVNEHSPEFSYECKTIDQVYLQMSSYMYPEEIFEILNSIDLQRGLKGWEGDLLFSCGDISFHSLNSQDLNINGTLNPNNLTIVLNETATSRFTQACMSSRINTGRRSNQGSSLGQAANLPSLDQLRNRRNQLNTNLQSRLNCLESFRSVGISDPQDFAQRVSTDATNRQTQANQRDEYYSGVQSNNKLSSRNFTTNFSNNGYTVDMTYMEGDIEFTVFKSRDNPDVTLIWNRQENQRIFYDNTDNVSRRHEIKDGEHTVKIKEEGETEYKSTDATREEEEKLNNQEPIDPNDEFKNRVTGEDEGSPLESTVSYPAGEFPPVPDCMMDMFNSAFVNAFCQGDGYLSPKCQFLMSGNLNPLCDDLPLMLIGPNQDFDCSQRDDSGTNAKFQCLVQQMVSINCYPPEGGISCEERLDMLENIPQDIIDDMDMRNNDICNDPRARCL